MIRRLLRLYPRAWRDRYGDELEELVESAGMTPSTAVDVVRSAIVERLRRPTRRTAGGPSMTDDRPGWPSAAFAILGFVALVPTLLFMSFSVLIYNLEVPLEAIRPVIEVAVGIVPVNIGFAVLPFVALALAAAPLVRFTVARDVEQGEILARVALRPWRQRLANVIVAGAATAVIAILVLYQVTENL